MSWKLILVSVFCVACIDPHAIAEDQPTHHRSAECPREISHEGWPPGTQDIHYDIDYWVDTWASYFDLDEPLLSQAEIQSHNRAMSAGRLPEGVTGELGAQTDLGASLDSKRLTAYIKSRLDTINALIKSKTYVSWDQDEIDEDDLEDFVVPRQFKPQLHVALRELQILCAPYPHPMKRMDLDSSVNRNACTRVKPQAPIQVLAEMPNDMLLVQTRLALGWIKSSDAEHLSPPLTLEQARDYLGPRLIYAPSARQNGYSNYLKKLGQVGLKDASLGGVRLPIATAPQVTSPDELSERSADSAVQVVPAQSPHVWLATAQEVRRVPLSVLGLSERQSTDQQIFTRRSFLTQLFKMLGHPYGLGGDRGGVDSARLVVNALEPFGIKAPRSAHHQAHMGTFSVDVSDIKEPIERINLFNAAFKRGVTLLYLPEHVMVYLGPDQDGVPRVLHAFGGYQQSCNESDDETTVRINQVGITDLQRGQGSRETSLLDRVTRIAVIGRDPGPALGLKSRGGLAQFRAPASLINPGRTACRRARNRARIFTSPRLPHKRGPTRFMVTRPHRDTPAQLVLYGPDGQVLTPELTRLGGPPFIYYSSPIKLKSGVWRAVYGEGQDVHSCTHVKVHKRPEVPRVADHIWAPQNEWSPHTEALFAGFVERLFQYPIEEDRSWTNLQDLLNVVDHNLLYHHLNSREESQLKLQPDCADLPYTLRAYFAWKMDLPFFYMTCTRGSKKKPPLCYGRQDSHQPRGTRKIGEDFQWFAQRRIAGHVHSSSARTVPHDEETELYPVALNHKTLRPGIVFADPYGHLLLIAGWVPQKIGGYGVLIGADAQPDGTIGRRRFWQGSFLFDPDHALVGAGFKSFRPLVKVDTEDEKCREGKRGKKCAKRRKSKTESQEERPPITWRPVSNQELKSKRWGALRFSDEQYRGSRQQFYDTMGSLTSPRPIEARVQMLALADALHESARRRVLSVNNGEEWIKKHPRRKMKMPSGYSIFLTAGPWEDFATPSRDMRLLIAIDTVLDIPSAVRRNPQRFGIQPQRLDGTINALQAELKEALMARTFEYTKSDGQSQTISLWDLTQRLKAMEVAYNPNDCVEVRWGAPKGSQERSTCRRAAPRRQKRKMARYRSWFRERRRPARGTR